MRTARWILILAAAAVIPACDDSNGPPGGPGGGSGPAGTIRFESAKYDFTEWIPPTLAPSIPTLVTVTREGGGAGAVSVMVVVSGGTASYDVDYRLPIPNVLAGVVLTWADGETGPKSFEFMIFDDVSAEQNETVELSLTQVTGGASIGTPATSTVTILDDDVMALPTS